MRIVGLQKMTLLDYPEHVAATVFVDGCNFRCPFCYNSELLTKTSDDMLISESEFFGFLDNRVQLLDGVCITGGEPTLQSDLLDFCLKIRNKGFLVKLDTNGTNPSVIKSLLDENAINYAAIDFKNTQDKYPITCDISNNAFLDIRESVQILLDSGLSFELRTTVVKEFHSKNDLIEMAQSIPAQCKWFIQNFNDGPSVLVGTGMLHPWSPEELKSLLPDLLKNCPATQLRGID